MKVRARLIIRGKVQGVGFRFFLKRHALMRNVGGWVRNLKGGEVEAVLEGEESQIKEIIKLCEKGPTLASVSKIDVVWEDKLEGYEDFKIIR